MMLLSSQLETANLSLPRAVNVKTALEACLIYSRHRNHEEFKRICDLSDGECMVRRHASDQAPIVARDILEKCLFKLCPPSGRNSVGCESVAQLIGAFVSPLSSWPVVDVNEMAVLKTLAHATQAVSRSNAEEVTAATKHLTEKQGDDSFWLHALVNAANFKEMLVDQSRLAE